MKFLDLPKLVSELDLKNEENDSDEDGWEEMEPLMESTKCLFCENTQSSLELAKQHLEETHDFKLVDLKQKFPHLNQYSFIKVSMIQYSKTSNLLFNLFLVGQLHSARKR